MSIFRRAAKAIAAIASDANYTSKRVVEFQAGAAKR